MCKFTKKDLIKKLIEVEKTIIATSPENLLTKYTDKFNFCVGDFVRCDCDF